MSWGTTTKIGNTFNPTSDLGANPDVFLAARRNFRIGQRFQAYFEIRNGAIDQSNYGVLHQRAGAGTTKSPCGTGSFAGIGGDQKPQEDPIANDKRFLSPTRTSISQVSGARIAFEGQAVDTYLNDRILVSPFCSPGVPIPCFGPVGQTTPWIWNQVEFNLNGQIVGPSFGSHTSIFSMPIYTRQTSTGPAAIPSTQGFSALAGQNLQNFIDKDVSYRFVIPPGAMLLP